MQQIVADSDQTESDTSYANPGSATGPRFQKYTTMETFWWFPITQTFSEQLCVNNKNIMYTYKGVYI